MILPNRVPTATTNLVNTVHRDVLDVRNYTPESVLPPFWLLLQDASPPLISPPPTSNGPYRAILLRLCHLEKHVDKYRVVSRL